jgi:hypothetical protein
MNWCARQKYQEKVEGIIDLPNEFWPGWTIRKRFLRGPGGIKFSPNVLRWLAVQSKTTIANTPDRTPIFGKLDIGTNAAND